MCGEPRRWRSFVIHRVAIAVARRRTGFEHVHEKRSRKLIRQLQLHRFLLSGSPISLAPSFSNNNIDPSEDPLSFVDRFLLDDKIIFFFFQLETIESSLKDYPNKSNIFSKKISISISFKKFYDFLLFPVNNRTIFSKEIGSKKISLNFIITTYKIIVYVYITGIIMEIIKLFLLEKIKWRQCIHKEKKDNFQ